MLKFERISKSLDLNITLRKRDPLFNRSMLQALAIALGIHLVAIFCFPVVSSKFRGSLRMLTPVRVTADRAHPADGPISSEIEKEESLGYLWPPSTRSFALSSLPEMTPYLSDDPRILSPSVLEEELRHPILALLDPKPEFDKPLTVRISGPLSQYKRIHSTHLSLPSLPEGVYRVSFQVAMENRTGEIFWYDCQELPSNEKILRLAEYILKNMRFENVEEGFVTSGEIEMIFSGVLL